MNHRPLKRLAAALSGGAALFLASATAGAQPIHQAYPMWYQQNWQQFGPQPYPWGAPQFQGNPYLTIPWFGPDLVQMWRQLSAGASRTSSFLQDMGDYYRFQLSIPGVNPNDIQMRVDGRMLSVAVHSQKTQDGQWQTSFSNYQQVYTLPTPVDSSRMQSHFENGVMTVNLPKVPNAN